MPVNPVKAWVENITIPTYPTPPGDLNPLFLERRINQGASGRIYPNPITDYVNNHTGKVDQTYEAVFIENEYIQLILVVHPKTWTDCLNKINCSRGVPNVKKTELQCRVQS